MLIKVHIYFTLQAESTEINYGISFGTDQKEIHHFPIGIFYGDSLR